MEIRPPTAADFDAVLALVRAADIAVWGDSDWTEAELRAEWAGDRELWLAELGGRVAGYATFELEGEVASGDGYVHPALRGRGVGSRILDLYEERAAVAPGARTLRSATLAGDRAADGLFRARGYRQALRVWRMVAHLGAIEVQPPAWPAGIESTALDVARDGRSVHALVEEAFADQWGHQPRSFAEWAPSGLAGPGFDPSLCVVARDGTAIVGVALNRWKRQGDWGWVSALAVARTHRRRGVGEALLRESFARFAARGERTVALGVDATNPTGATRLYERVGMTVLWEAVVHERELRR